MADEVRVQSSLAVRKTDDNGAVVLEYQSRPTAFQADMTGAVGPTPGALLALHTGTVVDLAVLTNPGFYRIASLDDDDENYIEYGIYDPQTDVFTPWGELGPGETYVGKFSRNLFEEYSGTGTGTTGPTNKIMVKAHGSAAYCVLEVFER